MATSLESLTDISHIYPNKFLKTLMQSKVWVRLLAMVVCIFVALIVLLVIGISHEQSNANVANEVMTLAQLVDLTSLLLRELSPEATDCLWYSLSPHYELGITDHTGGTSGFGLLGRFNSTDYRIRMLTQFLSGITLWDYSTQMADSFTLAMAQLNQIENFRYEVQTFSYSQQDIVDFYTSLVDNMVESIDVVCSYADTYTVGSAQMLVSWLRVKVALERERATIGLIILTENFSSELHAEWQSYVGTQVEWQRRFLVIASSEFRAQANNFLRGSDYRTLENLRSLLSSAYVPGEPTILPNITFFEWWNPVSSTLNTIVAIRFNITNAILTSARNHKKAANDTLNGYIILAVFSTALSIVVGVFISWSISKPWAGLLLLQTKLSSKVKKEDRVHRVISNFVPHDFLELMDVKSLRDVHPGDCVMKRCTVMQCGVRNFSTFAERMAPHQLFQFMNQLIAMTSPIIRRHRGFINTFQGSGMSALFLDPNDVVDAGLEILEIMKQPRERGLYFTAADCDLGIAIHTGDVILGIIGHPGMMSIEILGTAVQVSERLLVLASQLGCSMLLSKEAYLLLNMEGLSLRLVAELRDRSAKVQHQVYEVLQPNDHEKVEMLAAYNEAIKAHHQGQYADAAERYGQLLEAHPTDGVVVRRRALAEQAAWFEDVEDDIML